MWLPEHYYNQLPGSLRRMVDHPDCRPGQGRTRTSPGRFEVEYVYEVKDLEGRDTDLLLADEVCKERPAVPAPGDTVTLYGVPVGVRWVEETVEPHDSGEGEAVLFTVELQPADAWLVTARTTAGRTVVDAVEAADERAAVEAVRQRYAVFLHSLDEGFAPVVVRMGRW